MTRFEYFRRSLWLTLKRTRVSRISRRHIRVLAFWIVWLMGEGFLLHKEAQEMGPWGFVFPALLLVLAVGVGSFIRRHNERFGDSLLKLSVREAPAADDLRLHGNTIATLLLRTAATVDRAGIEALHRQRKVGPEHTGICRRRTLDLAQRPDLWTGYTMEEQALLISQEGSWGWEQVWPRVLQAEDVRVMRWVLKMDDVLTPFEFLEPDVTPALQVTVKPETIRKDDCLASFDLRPAQTMAQMMVTRCLGEGIRRGFLTEDNPEARAEYLRFAERMAADESQDMLVGPATVGTADQHRVEWIGQAALRRYRALTGLIAYLNGPPDAELKIL